MLLSSSSSGHALDDVLRHIEASRYYQIRTREVLRFKVHGMNLQRLGSTRLSPEEITSPSKTTWFKPVFCDVPKETAAPEQHIQFLTSLAYWSRHLRSAPTWQRNVQGNDRSVPVTSMVQTTEFQPQGQSETLLRNLATI
jgi:hypothetical protein